MSKKNMGLPKRAGYLAVFLLVLCMLAGAVCAAQAAEEPSVTVKLNAAVVRGAQKTADGEAMVWTPAGQGKGHEITYRVDYDVISDTTLEKGAIHIEIPMQVLKDSKGNYADTFAISLPTLEEALADPDSVDTEVTLAYRIENKTIILENFREITGPLETKGYVEIGYSTSKPTYEYADYGKEDNTGYEFSAEITVTAGEGKEISEQKTALPVFFDTKAEITRTDKQQPTLVKEWDKQAWGDAFTFDVEKSDDYWYLVWPVVSSISKDTTQYYTFTLKDVCGELIDKETGSAIKDASMDIVAYRFAGSTSWQKDNFVDGQTRIGDRTDYVLTKVPKESVQEVEEWQVNNTVTATVAPEGGYDSETRATDTENYAYHKPEFEDPPGNFNGWKRADGAYREFGPNKIFEGTSGSGIFRNSTLRTAEYSSYALENLQSGEPGTKSVSGLDYAAWVCGFPGAWTKDEEKNIELLEEIKGSGRDLTLDDIEQLFGQKKVTYELVDDIVKVFPLTGNANDAVALGSGDYQIDSIQYSINVYGWWFDEDEQELTYGALNPFTDGDEIKVYIKTATEQEEWKLYTTIPLTGGSAPEHVTFDKNDRSMGTVSFGENVVSFKLETENAYYMTSMGAVVNLTVFNTEHVQGLVKTAEGDPVVEIGVVNHMDGFLTDSKGNVYSIYPNAAYGNTDGKSDVDYVRLAQRSSSLLKEAVSGTNNAKKRQYEIRWKVSMKESIRTDEQLSSVEQQQGSVFYDLLPLGATLAEDSVAVYNGKTYGFLPESSLVVSQEGNYHNTGRTLVRVEILEEGTDFVLSFTTVHAWDVIDEDNTLAHNWVAYETGNEDIADGFADDGGPFGSAMAGLDPECGNKERFIYAERDFDINALRAAATGLLKQVKTLEDASFGKEARVLAGGGYVYRFRLQADADTRNENLILFDDLEGSQTAYPGKGGDESQWHGKLTGIDLSNLRYMGVEPVVYYKESTGIPELDTEEALKEYTFDPSEWTRWDEELELGSVGTIAIDMRKKQDGGDFVLEPQQTLSVLLYMDAPEALGSAQPLVNHVYPETYNDVVMAGSTYYVDSDDGNHFPMKVGYTTVEYVVAADIPLLKLGTDIMQTPIERAAFNLQGTSDYGTAVNLTQYTDRNGRLIFRNIEKGTYTLQEVKAELSTPDWLINPTEYTVTIADTGEVKISWQGATGAGGNITLSGEIWEEGSMLTVEDEPRVHADFSFRKMSAAVDGIESQPIEGVQFALAGTSDYGTKVQLFATSGKDGAVSFADLEKCTAGYELTEVKANDLYLSLGRTILVHVTAEGAVTVSLDGEPDETLLTTDAYGVVTVYNTRRYWDFSIVKRDANDDLNRLLSGAQFRLYGSSNEGTAYDVTQTSDETGVVTFTGIENGTYQLEETQAPSFTQTDEDGNPVLDENGEPIVTHYVIDPTKYYVTVADGAVSITKQLDGTQPAKTKWGETELYTFDNTQAADDRLIILKQWDDDKTEHVDPKVTIYASDQEPGDSFISVTYIANGGFFMKDNDTTHYSRNIVSYKEGTAEVWRGEYLVPGLTEEEIQNNRSSFLGWYFDADCTEPFVKDGEYFDDKIKELTSSITLYADWPVKYDYAYTGDVQTFTAPKDGWYQLQVWGAMGGDGWSSVGDDSKRKVTTTSRGGFGGYSTGAVYLTAGDQLYVFVGQRGEYGIRTNTNKEGWASNTYNGGGKTYASGGSGGGMTHISLTENPVPSDRSISWDPNGTLIVAGGGGGADNVPNNGTRGIGTGDDGGGGDGGGETGGHALIDGKWTNYTGGGTPKNSWNRQGQGEDNIKTTDTGGGGGGWYGGAVTQHNNGGAGGGSGYVSSVLKNAQTMSASEGYPLVNGGTSTDANYNGAPYNGYARITYIGQTLDSATEGD